MSVSFFKKLQNVEKDINSAKFNINSEEVEIRKNLRKLIRFVEDGYIAFGETEKFICKNFRLRSKEMLSLWNRMNKTKQKKESTLRVQIMNLSHKFQNIFGENFSDCYYKNDIEQIKRISDICDALKLEENSDLSSVFISEIYDIVNEINEKKYEIGECKDEFELLRRLMKKNIEENISEVDKDKIAFIVNSLNKPIIGADSHDINMVKVLLLNKIYSKQDRTTVPLKWTNKIGVLKEENLSLNENELNLNLHKLNDNEELEIEDSEDDVSPSTSIYVLIDCFYDYLSGDGDNNSELSGDELKNEVDRIKQFFSLYTPKGVASYLQEQNFNKVVFKKVLNAYEQAFENNDKN